MANFIDHWGTIGTLDIHNPLGIIGIPHWVSKMVPLGIQNFMCHMRIDHWILGYPISLKTPILPPFSSTCRRPSGWHPRVSRHWDMSYVHGHVIYKYHRSVIPSMLVYFTNGAPLSTHIGSDNQPPKMINVYSILSYTINSVVPNLFGIQYGARVLSCDSKQARTSIMTSKISPNPPHINGSQKSWQLRLMPLRWKRVVNIPMKSSESVLLHPKHLWNKL